MRLLFMTSAFAALLVGCTPPFDFKPKQEEPAVAEAEPLETESTDAVEVFNYDLEAQFKKFAPVKMDVDTSFLTASEKQVVNKLIEASRLMSTIYIRQLNVENQKLRAAIRDSDSPDKTLLLRMYNLHFGVCDSLAGGYVFFGDEPCPPGAGFYPADITKTEFEDWIAANPEDKEAFISPYTVIRRTRAGALVARPYSVEYKRWLEPAAQLLREAADLSENPTLKTFLNLRADAFLSDDYFASEMAWMDLDGAIEVAIGPYEVYDDGLFGYKTAFESFVTLKNPEESAALAKYKDYLVDMEANLPVPESYKNFKRGFESPIVVSYQIQGGGDNVPGVQTIAFNLPNDERVREAKGAKKVILNNVLGAKYDRILTRIGRRVLVQDQAAMTVKKYMAYGTLFHELSHSLGPGTITVDGVETTVSAQLKDLYSGLEEGKADVMGAYNILYMMERGEIDIAEKEAFLSTYFTGLFRSMRFGIDEAHGKGAAFQYAFFREAGAVEWLPAQKRFKIDFAKLETAISDLTTVVVILQGDGNYNEAATFLENYGKLDAAAKTVLGKLDDIPYDIRPIYPRSIE